ncbi:HAMP domain-containing sensor histidine kinase [Zobellia galactanivorans]|uniref:sensor histidine kinase n=1 Tax=Zobellia galactanivorans (strain DSM 12802 / CCUG 47099 / CIP 106680 / NCIMB 13871 / Dsij) TaxID=63186 RepID=UPI001C07CD63|nr:HAMP domain-containing sensor histidine kinase [Zobellia galactanivorans]MBU3026571.1 HAMP domain-containing histidine kinase [Zobellia galactanivorans]MDO6809287.1 HAMP domain-containing sensor histidine kinase [Zobellia galactanivorans]
MILLVVVASILIAGVTVYQYKEQSEDYHRDRLERKEEQVRQSVDYVLKKTTYPVTTENLGMIFNEEIYQIANVQNQRLNIYDLDGQLIKSSRAIFEVDSIANCLDPYILDRLETSPTKRFVDQKALAGDNYKASYTYINDKRFKPIGILNLPYYEDDSFNNMELREFLLRLAGVYFLMLLIAIGLAYFISTYITRSLQTISDMLGKTELRKRNQKILIDNPSEEIEKLVTAYNAMIDELEQSAVKLARSEREQAWREMAKQVAHEIKNPLTPMRLTVQSFERKFDPKDPNIASKVAEFSKSLIQQIDTMSSIASAFSNFAEMPAQQNETVNIVEIVRLALDIFNEDYIHFISQEEEIITKLDRTQLIRVVTNLVKNAIQAVPEVEAPRILVSVVSDGKYAEISVADNGIGIEDGFKEKIFEPKFTTKSSGMGLGLGMVKNIVETYNGYIGFTSKPGKGTVFTVKFPQVK